MKTDEPVSKITKAVAFADDLLAPGPFPDQDGGFGPDPGAHRDPGPEHGKQVDLLHHEAGPVLDDALRDGLVGLRGDGHVRLAPEGGEIS